MISVYYNENDRFAAAWLRELMKADCIPDGTVDERSITEVAYGDVAGFDQCHFFAGIGGWAYALRLAGWGSRPVWTGSCPCQPFSQAGVGQGFDDERHLWPQFRRLIEECRPATVFGEQVTSADGRIWLSRVRSDLEELDYAVGAADLCAAGIAAPHIRQRLYWMAYATGNGFTEQPIDRTISSEGENQFEYEKNRKFCAIRPVSRSSIGRVGDSDETGLQGWRKHAREHPDQQFAWEASESLPCLDGKARRIESGSFPLANRVPARMGRLRGYGNAIVPQVAAEFIKSFLDIEEMLE